MAQSSLERSFIYYYQTLGHNLPELVSEYRFHDKRKWRFDFCLPELKIAIECEGGLHKYGRHNRASGYIADSDKYNMAQEMGYIVLRYTSQHINDNPSVMIDQIQRVITMRQLQLKAIAE